MSKEIGVNHTKFYLCIIKPHIIIKIQYMMINHLYKQVTVITIIVISFIACGGKNKENKDSAQTETERKFTLPTVPYTLRTPESRSNYLSIHYWDNFDFNDTMYIHMPNITEQALVDYILVLNVPGNGAVSQSLKSLLASAEKEPTGRMYKYFTEIFDKYLYNPNSPYHNDELYIPVAEYIIDDKSTDETAKERLKYDLTQMLKNRQGEKASDFTYTLASGKSNTLYNTKGSSYKLVIFYNPDCHACKEIMPNVIASKIINIATKNKLLTILAIYPDEDIKAWKKHIHELPASWINGYDKATVITKKQIYDLRAIPTFYLLDSDDKVLLKDINLPVIEKYLVENNKLIYMNEIPQQPQQSY